jgi:CRP/FNR family transcriptional regulator, cyclic AMP receptor protein
MKGPYAFELNDNCQKCKLRGNGFFCQLPPAALKDLDAIKFVSAYPRDAILFMEKQTPRGIYVLCEGQLKLSVSSGEGKTLILRIAKPGEVLGLMATLSNAPHEITAETLRPCQVAFIRRDAFLGFLGHHPEAYGAVVAQLGAHYQTACEQLKTIGLCTSAPEKLAKLLLDFSAQGQLTKEGARVRFSLTHEEIGEFIGTTRETVTRTLSQFKSEHLIDLRGSTLLIQNRSRLESLISA